MRIMQNNSGLWWWRKTTQFYQETENSERQMKDKHNIVTWSLLLFAENVILILSINK